MGIEIERKFLVAGDGWREAAEREGPMAQGYLNDVDMIDSGAMLSSVRVRIEGDEARLNIKSRELGVQRQEFEYPIPLEDARALQARCVQRVSSSTRPSSRCRCGAVRGQQSAIGPVDGGGTSAGTAISSVSTSSPGAGSSMRALRQLPQR